jgi:hypothetical protein
MENVVVVGSDSYWGFGSKPYAKTYSDWCATLAAKFNKGLPDGLPNIDADGVVGFDGTADFWDIPRVMMRVFDYNLKNPVAHF